MKKLFIIFAVVLASCTSEPEPCECIGKFRLDGQTDLKFFYKKVEIDCNTGKLITKVPDNYQYWGCKN